MTSKKKKADGGVRRPVGRPAMSPEKKLEKRLLGMHREDWALVEKAAGKAGLKVNAFIRGLVLVAVKGS